MSRSAAMSPSSSMRKGVRNSHASEPFGPKASARPSVVEVTSHPPPSSAAIEPQTFDRNELDRTPNSSVRRPSVSTTRERGGVTPRAP